MVLCVLAMVAGCNALSNETAVTESVKISSMPPSAFVYNPIASNTVLVQPPNLRLWFFAQTECISPQTRARSQGLDAKATAKWSDLKAIQTLLRAP